MTHPRVLAAVFCGLICFPATALADHYPDAIAGAWGGRAAFAGDDNPLQAQKACHSFRNPAANEESGDVLVFVGDNKYSYGGYMDYIDGNVSVKQLGTNDWQIVDRHYDDGEAMKKAGYHNISYEAQLNGDVLIVRDGKDIERFNRCTKQERSRPATIADWESDLVKVLTQRKYYPPDALQRRQFGTVIVNFTVARDGHLLASGIKQSSHFILLDREALDLLNRVQPFSPLPTEYSHN